MLGDDCGTGVQGARATSTTTDPGAATTSAVPSSTTSPVASTSASTSTTASTSSTTTEPAATSTTAGIIRRCHDGSVMPENDKSDTLDHDGDREVDRCDDDSDGDGIPDVVEDANHNGKYQDDDTDGDALVIAQIGDGVPDFLDLDSDNDSVLDATEGAGNADGDDKPDFLDLTSSGSSYDLYENCFAPYDDLGAGFISRFDDADDDGVQAVVDSATSAWGASQLTGC